LATVVGFTKNKIRFKNYWTYVKVLTLDRFRPLLELNQPARKWMFSEIDICKGLLAGRALSEGQLESPTANFPFFCGFFDRNTKIRSKVGKWSSVATLDRAEFFGISGSGSKKKGGKSGINCFFCRTSTEAIRGYEPDQSLTYLRAPIKRNHSMDLIERENYIKNLCTYEGYLAAESRPRRYEVRPIPNETRLGHPSLVFIGSFCYAEWEKMKGHRQTLEWDWTDLLCHSTVLVCWKWICQCVMIFSILAITSSIFTKPMEGPAICVWRPFLVGVTTPRLLAWHWVMLWLATANANIYTVSYSSITMKLTTTQSSANTGFYIADGANSANRRILPIPTLIIIPFFQPPFPSFPFFLNDSWYFGIELLIDWFVVWLFVHPLIFEVFFLRIDVD